MRRTIKRARWNLAGPAAFLLLTGALLGEVWASGALPTAREVADRVIARLRQVEDQKSRENYTFTLDFFVEKLGDDGRVTEREESVYEPVWVDGARVPRLVRKNGQPLSAKDLEREQKRMRDLRADSRRKPQDEAFRLDHELVSRYQAEVAGLETIDGRAAYVLRFQPKSGELPERRRIDRLLNRLAGTVWVDVQEYEVVRVEGRLRAPVTWAWGLLATVERLDFVIEQVRLDDTTWMPKRTDATYLARWVLSTLHQRQRSTWSDFRREPPGHVGASR